MNIKETENIKYFVIAFLTIGVIIGGIVHFYISIISRRMITCDFIRI
jgi:hypothetical protein